MPAQALLTAEELLRLNLPNKRTELVRGMLVIREPAGYQHGDVAARLMLAIGNHVQLNGLGRVFAAETGFTLARKPDTVRAPDVAFISNARLPEPPPRGFAEMAPDLAVEVLSPDDYAPEVLEKVADWLKAGAQLIWVIDPIRLNARVYRADGTESLLGENDTLDGEYVLPQFACAIGPLLRQGRA
ncbi:MAG TPA: Uma2 family endonuclease [Gemmatimonadaceae bacterium]|nr:Uma2 family endonuclease [Gemmatimonadaceae bacterium]